MNELLITPLAMLSWAEVVIILAVLGVMAMLAVVVVVALMFALRRKKSSPANDANLPPRL